MQIQMIEMQKVRQQLDDADVDLTYLQDEFKQFKERKRLQEQEEERRRLIKGDLSACGLDDESENQDSVDNLDTYTSPKASQLAFSRGRLRSQKYSDAGYDERKRTSQL